MISLKLSIDDVRVMFRKGSTVCLNFSAYPLFGVSQMRLKTGPTICVDIVKKRRLSPLSTTLVNARVTGSNDRLLEYCVSRHASVEFTVNHCHCLNGNRIWGLKSRRVT